MSRSRSFADAFVVAVLAFPLAACGSGTGGSTDTSTVTNNVQPIVVDAGPTGDSGNAPFTSVTVCVPGTSQCQTIGGILVDSGSTGLRIFSSVLTVPLPRTAGTGNTVLGECAQFQDGFVWGPLAKADVTLAGEKAASIPVQIGGAPDFTAAPDSCASAGLMSENTVADFGANGVLGVGAFLQDCGPACALDPVPPPVYYSCAFGVCTPVTQPLAQQVSNPVAAFATDNNGILIDLPALPGDDSPTVAGSLIFGIGTQSNNQLGTAAIFLLDQLGTLTTTFQGKDYSGSIIDSGSNALYLLDSATVGAPLCPDTKDFYCPPANLDLTATNRGLDGRTGTVSFRIANADALFNTGASAIDDIGGPNAGSFDWGLPFFYGRRVFTAFEATSTPGGVGPYIAY